MELVGYGKTQCNKLLNNTLVEFAYAFVDTEDLRVIKQHKEDF